MKDAKKLNLDFPQLRRLDTVKYIPRWVAKIHAIAMQEDHSKEQLKVKKVKSFRILRQEALKKLLTFDPSKLEERVCLDFK